MNSACTIENAKPSFALETKAELCRRPLERQCCCVAEAYGVLMFCRTFNPLEIRISTSCNDFILRLPRMFSKAFGVKFDVLPAVSEELHTRRSLVINNPESISKILDILGIEPATSPAVHINSALLEEQCCRSAFIRGAFLAGGSVTAPDKSFHLELSTTHKSAAGETSSVLQELGFQVGISERGGNMLLYFKQADVISDLLTVCGASVSSMSVMTAKVEREMRNKVTRQINCDSANADKTVQAAQLQLDAIRRYSAMNGGLETLPEELKAAALLRATNPEASLADLARLSFPPVTKSCLSHRLKKIISLVSEEEK